MKIILFVLAVSCWGISKGNPLRESDSSFLVNEKKEEDLQSLFSNIFSEDDIKSLKFNELKALDSSDEPSKISVEILPETTTQPTTTLPETTTQPTTTQPTTTQPTTTQPTTTQPTPTQPTTTQPTTTQPTTTQPTPTTPTTTSPTSTKPSKQNGNHFFEKGTHVLAPFASQLINSIKNFEGSQVVREVNKIAYNFGNNGESLEKTFKNL